MQEKNVSDENRILADQGKETTNTEINEKHIFQQCIWIRQRSEK